MRLDGRSRSHRRLSSSTSTHRYSGLVSLLTPTTKLMHNLIVHDGGAQPQQRQNVQIDSAALQSFAWDERKKEYKTQ